MFPAAGSETHETDRAGTAVMVVGVKVKVERVAVEISTMLWAGMTSMRSLHDQVLH